MKKTGLIISLLAAVILAQGQEWRTHFAYNNVTQIAMAKDRVYAISDGSLFSVEKQSEKIQTYDRLSGLHGTDIACIGYDDASDILFIAYRNGKIDILSASGVQYVGDLYDKDMTQLKTIYNVTFNGRTAYISTHFGIQTFNLRENKLVDSYWLRPGGLETPISDVRVIGDSIFAFGLTGTNTADSLFCASLQDNLVDYTYWKREKNTGRISQDHEKGVHYTDGDDEWRAGGTNGIVRNTLTDEIAYKPNGPISNIPYRIFASQGKVFVVQGGRWGSQYQRPGHLMIYENGQWTNISADSIKAVTKDPVLDFMNVAVDPRDKEHYFVTSYGTGLYEFRGTKCVQHYIASDDNPIMAAAPSDPKRYTRLDGAVYDNNNNLWFINGGEILFTYRLVCLDTIGTMHGLTIEYGNSNVKVSTPVVLILDKLHNNYKWFGSARGGTCVILLDDHGTPLDNLDDRVMRRTEWTNQKGQSFMPQKIFTMKQDMIGRLWIGTEQGPAYIDRDIDFFVSDAIVQPDVIDENGENPLLTQEINDICFDEENRIWIGTAALGVYVLNSEATEIVAHYTTDNSIMPSNSILSLAYTEEGVVFIGTSEGLVEFKPGSSPDSSTAIDNMGNNIANDPGSMLRWRLHFSYTGPQELVATSDRIYATANGALFYLDRSTDQLEYLSKATGLNGNSIRHITYDNHSHQLIIAYDDGRIDLLDDEDNIRQMPDLYMKASSVAVNINAVSSGKHHCYLAMPFGIIAIDANKAIVNDTYYIGFNASSIDVRQIIEHGDSLFAFSEDTLYSASLADNLADFHFWKRKALPKGSLTNAMLYNDDLYTLQDSILFRKQGDTWQQVLTQIIRWVHVSEGQLLFALPDNSICRLGENGKIIKLSSRYIINDAIFSQGEHWLAEQGYGLIRLGSTGDDYFHTDGPNSNFAYTMCSAHGQIYSAIGGRWASQYMRYAKLNIYDGNKWRTINNGEIGSKTGRPAIDVVSIAVDPDDAGHFFAATYGTGVFEFKNYADDAIYHYGVNNSTLSAVNNNHDPNYYTRTDGVMMDANRNLWVLNATSIGKPLHVRSNNGQWHAIPLISGGQSITLTTPSGIWIDKRDENRKWLMDQRNLPGVILFDDGGTPTNTNDDRCLKRSTFVDQNGHIITPSTFRCFAQDNTNRIWIGTPNGPIIIPSNIDFFKSNTCHRLIIPRNDGTGLGDYLLGDEQINCLAVDGGNRMWIGTEFSGLYLIEDDTITVAHFTQYNSLLPSNSILSITIQPETGEVFVGTDKGLASYRSDASEAADDFSKAYAFPNPVRPNYGGMISIANLMENTIVNIVDAGGNLVCKTKSHGGLAVWDGKLPDGRRATAGVYTALCNEPNGKHTVIKILVIR